MEIREILIKALEDLIVNTGAISSCLITEDGLVLAEFSNNSKEENENEAGFAAITASILSMADRGIEIINKNKKLEQIKLKTTKNDGSQQDITILITRVISNVLLQIIFSMRINIGLIQFEVNNTIKRIKKIFENDKARMIFTEIGSLL